MPPASEVCGWCPRQHPSHHRVAGNSGSKARAVVDCGTAMNRHSRRAWSNVDESLCVQRVCPQDSLSCQSYSSFAEHFVADWQHFARAMRLLRLPVTPQSSRLTIVPQLSRTRTSLCKRHFSTLHGRCSSADSQLQRVSSSWERQKRRHPWRSWRSASHHGTAPFVEPRSPW